MFGHVRPTSLLGWGILFSYLLAIALMVWAVAIVDWWSTATSLFGPDWTGYGPLTKVGSSLLSGYPGIAMALILVLPCGWIISARNRFAALLLGFVGIVLTVVASQLDSPITGLVATNAWIPAVLAWFFYFASLVTALSTRDPQLEFEPRPDSSDG